MAYSPRLRLVAIGWLVKQNQPVSKIETKSDTNLRSLYESWFRNALISKSVILWWQANKTRHPNPHKHQPLPFSFIFVAMIFFWSYTIKNIPDCCSGRSGMNILWWKMACTPQQIKHTPSNWQAPIFISLDRFIMSKMWSLPIWGSISQRANKNLPILLRPQLAPSDRLQSLQIKAPYYNNSIPTLKQNKSLRWKSPACMKEKLSISQQSLTENQKEKQQRLKRIRRVVSHAIRLAPSLPETSRSISNPPIRSPIITVVIVTSYLVYFCDLV